MRDQVADTTAQGAIPRTLRTGRQVATWATLWPQMTRDERTRAASLMIEPEGLRVRVPAKGTRGRHNAFTAGPPSDEVLDQMIVDVRLRPDFAHALDLLKSVQASVQASVQQVDDSVVNGDQASAR